MVLRLRAFPVLPALRRALIPPHHAQEGCCYQLVTLGGLSSSAELGGIVGIVPAITPAAGDAAVFPLRPQCLANVAAVAGIEPLHFRRWRTEAGSGVAHGASLAPGTVRSRRCRH